jgi:hypothetical protein
VIDRVVSADPIANMRLLPPHAASEFGPSDHYCCCCLPADAAELLKLAQAAEQQGLDPTTYAALQQQAYDPNWAAFASMGMPQAALMSNYYWGQPFQQQSYQQRHASLSKLEHASMSQPAGTQVFAACPATRIHAVHA